MLNLNNLSSQLKTRVTWCNPGETWSFFFFNKPQKCKINLWILDLIYFFLLHVFPRNIFFNFFIWDNYIFLGSCLVKPYFTKNKTVKTSLRTCLLNMLLNQNFFYQNSGKPNKTLSIWLVRVNLKTLLQSWFEQKIKI